MKLNRVFLLPGFFWFFLFVLVPLFIVVGVSFAQRGPYGQIEWIFNLTNFEKVFSLRYAEIFFESVKLAALTSVICLALGLVIAWAMATANPQQRSLFVMAVALPFLTNLIIRIYALRLFVGADGPLQFVLNLLHIPFDPFQFTQNKILVIYGMVTTYLPFMVLPLYGAFEKFDFTLVEAAQDLGAGPWQTFFKVILPNLKTAIGTGFLLVFVPSLGEYVIPDLLGGAKVMLIGNLITEMFLKSRDWPMGSALSVALMLTLLIFAFLGVVLKKGRKNV